MPIYVYGCEKCGCETTVSHSMTETMEYCDVCETIGTLVRRPSMFSSPKNESEQKEKPGSYVKEFIEDAKKDLNKQKEELSIKND